VWAASYIFLPLAKLYRPIWEYDAKVLARTSATSWCKASARPAPTGCLPGGEHGVGQGRAQTAVAVLRFATLLTSHPDGVEQGDLDDLNLYLSEEEGLELVVILDSP
jgi:hypothetical protein